MFKQLTPHVYYRSPQHYSDRPTIGYIKGDDYSVLFEAGASAKHAQEINSELERANLPYPKYVVVSHWHWDHCFGLCAWDKAATIAGNQTNRELKKLSALDWKEEAIAQRVREGSEINFCYQKMRLEYLEGTSNITVCPAAYEFEKSLSLDLGGVTVKLEHVGGPHSRDSVIAFIPEDKVIFIGDSQGKDLYGKPWEFDIEHEEDFEKNVGAIPYDEDILKEYLAKMRTYDFNIVISGHCEPYSREEFFRL